MPAHHRCRYEAEMRVSAGQVFQAFKVQVKKRAFSPKHSMEQGLVARTEGLIRNIMLVECCKILTRLRSCRSLSAAANLQNTATSLGQAVRQADTVDVLDLQGSADLLCVNLMCEKVGDPCICRLSRVLEKLHHLTRLNLANNQLISLPDSIGQLEQLQYLDLSNNRLQSLPDTMQQLRHLKVLRLEGNSDLAISPDLLSLDSLEKLFVDDVLAASLPAGLRKLTQ